MGIYQDLGVTPIINAAGTATRLGGPLMADETVQAMAEAARECAPMDQLQAAASKLIAGITGAEAGYVTAGAASALTLATAACICGLDLSKMERLPHTDGMPNEVIIPREHRSGYDHAIRAAGARLVEVGMNEQVAGAGARRTEAWEIEAAFSKNTVAVAYCVTAGSQPPLEEVIALCRRRGVPVIVDAAAELPPVSNLRKFIALGADLVTFSGGKAIRGPQSTGILIGRRDYIMSAALQHLDLDEHWRTWDPPPSLIDRDRIPGLPRHGLGRGFKVAREEIVALLVALRSFSEGRHVEDMPRLTRHLEMIVDAMDGLDHVSTRRSTPPAEEGYPMLEIRIDEQKLGRSAFDVCRQLKRGSPPVYVAEGGLALGVLVINPMNLDDRRLHQLIDRLKDVLKPHSQTENSALR